MERTEKYSRDWASGDRLLRIWDAVGSWYEEIGSEQEELQATDYILYIV